MIHASLTPDDLTLQEPWEANVIAVRPNDGRLYVVNGNSLVWLNKDAGAWDEFGGSPGLKNAITQLVFDPDPVRSNSVVYAATSQGLFASYTAGELFVPLENELSQTDVTAIAAAQTAEGETFLFIGSAGGEFIQNNGPSIQAVPQDSAQLVEAGVYRQTTQTFNVFIPLARR